MYYHSGKLVRVKGSTGNDGVLVEVVRNYRDVKDCDKEEYFVNKGELYTPINKVFRIGDRVASKGSMIGRVVGYEYGTNRAVVISDKIGNYANDRTRYVYFANELDHYVDLFEFVPGNYYNLNNSTTVFTTFKYGNIDDIILVDHRGHPVRSELPRKTNRQELEEKYNIEDIKQVKGF